MKPISRLRMRARSESESDSAGFPFSQYRPSVGESSSPRSESSVDLPQPEGPALETYSPCAISRWPPDSACVSTSSVKKTFVTPSSLMTGCPFVLMPLPSLQPHSVVRVPRAHVGEDDPVAGPQALEDLDGVHGALAEADLHADCLVPVLVEAEEAHLALLLAERRPPDVQDVLQPVELDRSIDREIRAGPRR